MLLGLLRTVRGGAASIDERRLRLLAELGYHVIQVTWDDLNELPEQLLSQIRTALARRRPA